MILSIFLFLLIVCLEQLWVENIFKEVEKLLSVQPEVKCDKTNGKGMYQAENGLVDKFIKFVKM